MKIENFLEYMKTHEKVEVGTDAFAMFHELSQRALKITMELNNKYHTPEEIVDIFSELLHTKKLTQHLECFRHFIRIVVST